MLKYEIYDIGDEKMVSLNQNSNSCYLKRIKQLYSLYGFVKEEEAEGYILFSNGCFFLISGIRHRFQPAYCPAGRGIAAICKMYDLSVLRYCFSLSV